jgi:DNA-directed RNA polymerase subunit M/transcription elongation factor TFIIS
MTIQFCIDCGNILDKSTEDEVACDVCGKLNKSLFICLALPAMLR